MHGEEGMVKFRGIRVELGEVEAVILDDEATLVGVFESLPMAW